MPRLREVLTRTPLVDHHAHGILRAPPGGLDEFRGLFSESPDPRQWPHIATSVTYRRAIRLLAEHLGCDPDERAVYERRLKTDPDEYAAGLLRATNTQTLLVDEGFPAPGASTDWRELGRLAGCRARPVMRIEQAAERAGSLADLREAVGRARGKGYVALKTIAAYRGGLDLDALPSPRRRTRLEGAPVRSALLAALDANRQTGRPLPVQVHTGFGDSDLRLPSSDPSHLKPLIERFPDTTFVLLHCYPFVRQAGWLAHVYGNVCFDVSLTIPHVSRPDVALAEALELAPASKLLYASDASRAPELYLLAAAWWRQALGRVLPALLDSDEEAQAQAARMILSENAQRVYGLEGRPVTARARSG